MISGKEHLGSILISSMVVAGAFTIQDISIDFFLLCFGITLGSYLIHEFFHIKISDRENLDFKHDISVPGILATLISGVVTGGQAVLAIPTKARIKSKESDRWGKWMIEVNDRDIGVTSISGPLVNLALGTLFLCLYGFFGPEFLATASLINLWLGTSNLLPFHPFDGGSVVAWGGWVWFIGVLTGATGLIALFLI